jgi:uncharacterized membrane protein YuzA (DUF378 family)
MKGLHTVTFLLLIIGGLNWLLTAFGFNVVAKLGETLEMVVYVLVGLSAVVELVTHKKSCKMCSSSQPTASV